MSLSQVYRVAEIFGPTIQGEGNQAGQLCYFVRFGGCDYRCAWCDSLHAVLPQNVRTLPEMTAEQIVTRIGELGRHAAWVVLSGGNPALWNLEPLINQLHSAGKYVAVETQGSKWATWLNWCDNVVISPKPPSSGMETDWLALEDTVSRLTENEAPFILKVVVFGSEDLAYARKVHKLYPDVPFYISCGTVAPNTIFAAATGPDTSDALVDRFKWLLDQVSELKDMDDVRILPQVHVLIWGHKLGV